MKDIPFEEEKIYEIVNLWNKNIGKDFLLNKYLFEQNSINNRFICKQASRLVVNESGRVIGLIIAKKDDLSMFSSKENKLGWIQVLLVDREYRRQGIGTRLLNHAEKKLRKNGIKKILIGKDPYHYFPGILSDYKNTIKWFEKRSYQIDGTEYDLIRKFSKEKTEVFSFPDNLSFSLLDTSEQEELKSFMKKYFPGRWEFELDEYFKHGGTGREFVIAREQKEIIGFCRINDEKSITIASNVYWSSHFKEPIGGIGPLGIASDKRKNGYGISIVKAAIKFLRDRSINIIIIDWTTLLNFYQKLNFSVWKEYITLSKKIEN